MDKISKFDLLCEMLPPDVKWGDHITPDIVEYIVQLVTPDYVKDFQKGKHSVRWNPQCNGWCIYLEDGNNLTATLVEGPFKTRKKAELTLNAVIIFGEEVTKKDGL